MGQKKKTKKEKTAAQQKKSGAALIFTIFVIVALQAAMAASYINMIRHQRNIVHQMDHIKQTTLNESAIDEAIRFLADFVSLKGDFPKAPQGQVADAEQAISDWYSSGPDSFQVLHGLEEVNFTRLNVDEIAQSPDEGLSWRDYRIQLTSWNQRTHATERVTQEVRVTNGLLFDFSVFSNGDLEIQAGPDLTLEGPIFSNGNIYMMNDRGSTLTLTKSDDLTEPGNRQPYIMRAVGGLYFYYNRAIAQNYLLQQMNWSGITKPARSKYVEVLNRYLPKYIQPDPLTEPNSLKVEVDPSLTLPDGSHPPMVYYFDNKTLLHIYPAGNGLEHIIDGGTPSLCSNNTYQNCIRVDDGYGNLGLLSPYHPHLISGAYEYGWGGRIYHTLYQGGNYGNQNASSVIGMSGALDVDRVINENKYPKLADDWSPSAPNEHASSRPYYPAPNPKWSNRAFIGAGNWVLNDSIGRLRIPIGDPSGQGDPHVLIEPVNGTETANVLEMKFQQLARTIDNGFDLECEMWPCVSDYVSPDLQDFLDRNIVDAVTMPDYRAKGTYSILTLDINELLRNYPNAKLIYVETDRVSDAPNAVKLINGERIPQEGLTIVTNGRLFIEGDYNTFMYKTPDGQPAPSSYATPYETCASLQPWIHDNVCYCDASDWEDESCKFQPSAIFSDSFGLLSNDWRDNYDFSTDLEDREVDTDVMVNTALATGLMQSQLVPTSSFANCSDSMTNCEHHVSQCTLVSITDPQLPYVLRVPKQNEVLNCRYYEYDNIVYINKASAEYKAMYQRSVANHPAPDHPRIPMAWDPGPEPPHYNSNWVQMHKNDTWKIPVYVDATMPESRTTARLPYENNLDSDPGNDIPAPKGIRAFHGVLWRYLYIDQLFQAADTCLNYDCKPSGDIFACPNFTSTCDQAHLTSSGCCEGNLASPECLPNAEGGGFTCNTCLEYECMCKTSNYDPTNPECCENNFDTATGLCNGTPAGLIDPQIWYPWAYYYRLYTPQYSGGLENLINFQEDWTNRKVRFLGTLTIPWYTKQPIGFYDTNYYFAPKRDYRYNESLKDEPPPETPSTYGIERKKWSFT